VASEDIGNVYKTQIPGYEDAADIQAALRLYHYGTTTVPATESELIANSTAGHIKALDTRLDSIEADPARSIYTADAPTGSSLVNGYIWVDSDTSIGNVPTYGQASYSATAPDTDLVVGALWVDSDSSPLKLYVWSGDSWRVIGE
jgi:hypothetical protein